MDEYHIDEEIKHITKFRFLIPSCINVTGPSGSGKTEFIFRIIHNRKDMFSEPPTQVIYCFKVWQERFRDIKRMDKRGLSYG